MRAAPTERVWSLAGWAVAVMAFLPVLALLWTATQGSAGLWPHLLAHVLPSAAANTVSLLLGVGMFVAVVGCGCAWLVSVYDFPGRRIFDWALLLPLAVPTYIVAFAYLDLMHPLGPIQTVVRAVLGYDSPRDFRLPDIRSLPACIVLLGLVLYPYVYLTVRATFAAQSSSLIEAARSLGTRGPALFGRVAMPLARPAVAAGVSLALLETLNDIGASEFLGVKTLTVSVYTTWVTRNDLPGASQIALSMLALVLLTLALERYNRGRRGYAALRGSRPLAPQPLRGGRAALAMFACLLPVLFGFLLPASYLALEACERLQGAGVSAQLWASAWNSLRIALAVTVVTLGAGLVLVWGLRLAQLRRQPRLAAFTLRAGSVGYALPGTVLAIGLLAPLGWADGLWSMLREAFGLTPQALLLGSISGLVLACSLRFLAVAGGGLEAGLARVPLSTDQAARALGAGPWASLRRIHLPLLRPALAAAAMLVFVDAMKELPATLLLRPVGVETLATWLYAEAARGTYEEGSVAALLIVLIGLPGVVLLARLGFGHRA